MQRKHSLQIAFGLAIRKRREKVGISQEELAARAGLHRTYVSDVERGERNISLMNIGKLAVALHTSLSSLFKSLPNHQMPSRDEGHK